MKDKICQKFINFLPFFRLLNLQDRVYLLLALTVPTILIFLDLISIPSFGQSEPLKEEERRLFGKFLEQGEETFRRNCYKSVNLDNEFAKDFAQGAAEEGILKEICESRINKFKNLNATLFENQMLTSNSTGQN